MTIKSVVVKPGYPQATIDSKKGGSYEYRWVVTSDSPNEGPLAVIFSLPVTLGTPYSAAGEMDPSSLCCNIPIPDRTGPYTWEASARFEVPEPNRPDKNPDNRSIFDRLPDIRISREQHQKVVWKAYRVNEDGSYAKLATAADVQAGRATELGKPMMEGICNSAGGMFSQPIMRDASRVVLDYVRNERYFPHAWNQNFSDTLNSVQFLGWPPFTVLCRPITGQWKRESITLEGPLPPIIVGGPAGTFVPADRTRGFLTYWQVAYQFVFDRYGWTDDPLDQGGFYIDTEPSMNKNGVQFPNPNYRKKKAVRDVDGVPMHGPFLLDGQGGLLSDADVMAGNVKYRRYTYRDARDFSPMQIVIPY